MGLSHPYIWPFISLSLRIVCSTHLPTYWVDLGGYLKFWVLGRGYNFWETDCIIKKSTRNKNLKSALKSENTRKSTKKKKANKRKMQEVKTIPPNKRIPPHIGAIYHIHFLLSPLILKAAAAAEWQGDRSVGDRLFCFIPFWCWASGGGGPVIRQSCNCSRDVPSLNTRTLFLVTHRSVVCEQGRFLLPRHPSLCT